MLFNFFYALKDLYFGFNVFRYITFRAALAAMTSFLICIVLGKPLIKWLQALKLRQQVRSAQDAPGIYEFHKNKQGTPTMGGIIIVGAVVLASLLWADMSNTFVLITLMGMVWFGILGCIDDFLKITHRNSKGLSITAKLGGQIACAVCIACFLYMQEDFSTRLDLPFFKHWVICLSWFFIPFTVLVIVGAANAVNLTDGLDGLAIGCVTPVALTYCGLSYVTGNIRLSEYLNIIYLPSTGELSIICAALVGAGLGFLWFNSYPATVFMGDTGSLALGGCIGIISVLIKKEILLVLVGAIFVAEALSVLIQILAIRKFRTRVFLMAPFHHHLQMKGWSEPKIIIRFWIVAIILALFSLITLKLR